MPSLRHGDQGNVEMKFNASQFCTDNGIETSPAGNKFTRPGWVHIRCPFCPNTFQGGFNIEAGFYSCFTCGGKWLPKVIAALLSTNISKAKVILAKYSSGTDSYYRPEAALFDRPLTISLPPNSLYLSDHDKHYLGDRGFTDYNQIIRTWDLRSTGYLGFYSHRILAPVYFQGQIVTFQCRATHPGQTPPYLACADRDEVIHHKHIVYGYDYAIPYKQCVVVEGITDVWRLGKGAVATFGKKYTKEQLLLLANSFDRVFVLMDPDVNLPEYDLTEPLCLLGVEAETIWIDPDKSDPGSWTDQDAKLLMKDLGF